MDVPVKDIKSWQLTTASISLHGVGTGCKKPRLQKNTVAFLQELDWHLRRLGLAVCLT